MYEHTLASGYASKKVRVTREVTRDRRAGKALDAVSGDPG